MTLLIPKNLFHGIYPYKQTNPLLHKEYIILTLATCMVSYENLIIKKNRKPFKYKKIY